MRLSRLLVVGATGRVGALVLPFWQASSLPILLQHRKRETTLPVTQRILWDPSVSNSVLKNWIAQNETPNCMVIFSGVVPGSEQDLFLNSEIALSYIRAAEELSIPKVLLASTSAVYGNYLDRPFSEQDETRPVTAYGKSKLEMERACISYQNSKKMEITILRIGNVAGADALLTNVIAQPQRKIFIHQDVNGSTPLRSYIGPETLAYVIAKLANFDRKLPRILNIGAPSPVEMKSLADAASVTWCAKHPEDSASQIITLDTTLLWRLIPKVKSLSEPTEMIRQLKSIEFFT